MKNNKPTKITEQQLDELEAMIYGPYEPEWFREDGVIANTTKEIAERMGVPNNVVVYHSNKIIKKRMNKNN